MPPPIMAGTGLALGISLLIGISIFLPKGHVTKRQAHFGADRQTIWNIIADAEQQPSWRKELLKVERAPDQNGHVVWAEKERSGQTVPYETVESKEPELLVRKIANPHLPYGGTWTLKLEAEGTGTVLTITEQGEVYSPLFKIASQFMDKRATMTKYLTQLADRLGEKPNLGD